MNENLLTINGHEFTLAPLGRRPRLGGAHHSQEAAMDARPRFSHALDRFLESFEGSEAVHVELGVDQADTATLRERIDHHIGGPLDVVVDDASHLLHQTTVSFDCLFPLIRPGGLFIIEDWSHEHQLASGCARDSPKSVGATRSWTPRGSLSVT